MESIEGKGFEKRQLFSTFALSHLEAMRLLRKFGLLRQEGETKERAAWGKLEGKERSFRNIAEHCLVVGMVADVILERLVENGHLAEADRRRGAKAAILHDLTKRQELEAQYGVEKGGKGRHLDPAARKKFVDELLEKQGVSAEDWADFNLSRRAGSGLWEGGKVSLESPRELIEWTIAVADYSVAHTNLVNPGQRLKEAIERGGYEDEFQWWFKKLYGDEAFKQAGSQRAAAEVISERVVGVFAEVEEKLKPKLGLGENETISDFIEEQIIKRYGGEQPEN